MRSAVRLRLSRFGLVATPVLFFMSFIQAGCGTDPSPPLVTKSETVYIGNEVSNTVSAYNLDHDGLLTAVPGSPFALGGPTVIADPAGKRLFSLGLNSGAIFLNVDGIGQSGILNLSSSVSDDSLAGVRAVNPTSTALYVSSINAAENNWGWKVYSIQPDGSLQFIDGLIDQVAGRLSFTPDGSTAFAAYCYLSLPNIEQFTVDSSGMLTNTRRQITPAIPFGECPNAVAVNPSGNLIVAPWSDVNGLGPNFITLFNIDSGTHELSPTAGSEFPTSGPGQDVAFDTSGHFLVTAQSNGVGVYKVGQNSLTEVSGSPFGRSSMDRVMFAPSGAFVVAISRTDSQIFVFRFDNATGTLTLAPASPVLASRPYDLAIVAR